MYFKIIICKVVLFQGSKTYFTTLHRLFEKTNCLIRIYFLMQFNFPFSSWAGCLHKVSEN